MSSYFSTQRVNKTLFNNFFKLISISLLIFNLATLISPFFLSLEARAEQNQLESEAISPVLERVQKISEEEFLAVFGYHNRNQVEINIPVGEKNRFTPSSFNNFLIQDFKPGRQVAVFTVPLQCGAGNLVWTLTSPNGSRRTSTAGVPDCPEEEEEDEGENENEDEDGEGQDEEGEEGQDGDEGQDSDIEEGLDKTPLTSNLHFFKELKTLSENQLSLPITACYYLNPVYSSNSIKNSGSNIFISKTAQFDPAKQELLTENLNQIYPYLKLGKFEKSEKLSFKFETKNPSRQVVSNDLDKVKIQEIPNGLFRFFVNFQGSSDDLILDLLAGNCESEIDASESLFLDIFETPNLAKKTIYTNQDNLNLAYLADNWKYFNHTESPEIPFQKEEKGNPNQVKDYNHILAIRFLDENQNPIDLGQDADYLTKCNPPLCNLHPNHNYQKENQAPGLQWSQRWYSWNGGYFLKNLDLPQDGVYEQTFQVIDYYGNIETKTQTIIKNSTSPEIKNLNLKSSNLDFVNKDKTNFQAEIEFDLLDQGLSQLKNRPDLQQKISSEKQKLEFKYSLENQDYTDWQTGNLGKNNLQIKLQDLSQEQLETLKKEQKLEIKIKFKTRDGLGNKSTEQEFTILYEVQNQNLELEFKVEKTRKLSKAEIQKIQEKNQDKKTKIDLSSPDAKIKVSYNSIVSYITNLENSSNIPIQRVRFLETLKNQNEDNQENSNSENETEENTQDLNSSKLNQWQELGLFDL